MLLLARNSLKEDTFIIMVNTLLLWILVGLLVGWMLVFALLACVPVREKTLEHEAAAMLPTQATAQRPSLPAQTPVRLLTKLQALPEDVGMRK